MADITIESAALGIHSYISPRAGIFWKSTTVGYIFYLNVGLDVVYRKTSDGGATWADAVTIRSGLIASYDCWADWQTAGDAGTKIHIVYVDTNSNDIRYVYLETATDTVGGDDQLVACAGSGAISTGFNLSYAFSTITKTRGGNIAVAVRYRDSLDVVFSVFYTSPDGDTWTSKTTPFDASVYDYLQIYPGNEADNQDIWGVYWDVSANEISLKTFDNSADSWSEQSIATSMTESAVYLQMDGQVRLSDGHLILAAWNLYDNAAADLNVWDINGAGSITAKTNIITNEAESFAVSVFINQVNNDIYVAYFSGSAAESTVACFYQKSTDGGANWSGETAMQANAEDDERWVSAGCMKASLGGKFQPVWFNDDLDDLFTNTTNGITINVAVSGWTHIAKVNGVASASIAKINSVAKASIGKLNGIAV